MFVVQVSTANHYLIAIQNTARIFQLFFIIAMRIFRYLGKRIFLRLKDMEKEDPDELQIWQFRGQNFESNDGTNTLQSGVRINHR